MPSDAAIPTPRSNPESAPSGRWFLLALGLTLAILGAFFVWLLGRSFLRAREMHAWPEAPCVILSSEIEERVHDPQSPPEFRHAVSFGYEWQGTARSSTLVTLRGSAWSSKQDLVAKQAAEYPVGKRFTCRINPAAPDLAVLKPDSLAPGYSIWFPGLFVIGGLGIAVNAMTRGKPGRR